MAGLDTDQVLLSALQPPDRRGLYEVVLDQLLAAIRAGQLRPGDRLLEADIAERLGISRGIVREAIRMLEQEGLVASSPHRGSFVARLTVQDAAEIYSMRKVLEMFAVELAVKNADEKALAEMVEIVQEIVAASEGGNRMDRVQRDMQFHERVCLASGHRLLYRSWKGLMLRLCLVHFDPRRTTWPQPILVHRAESHLELVEQIRRRDKEAAVAWMSNHIDVVARKAVEEISASLSAADLSVMPQNRVLPNG